MVQMKGRNKQNIITKSKKDFISHMVQMKATNPTTTPPPISDFISHMVQMKVIPTATVVTSAAIFISHMVQMKELCSMLDVTYFGYFISHMVQMKVAYFRGVCDGCNHTLYPTWFR